MWTVITKAANDWLRHHDARLGAALAYYSVFSLGPLLLIVVSIAGVFFGGDAVREALTGQFRALLGPTGSQAVEAMLKGASSTGSGVLSGVVGVVLLLVAALGVVVQLKDALNTIWETKEPESWRLVVPAHLPRFVRGHSRVRLSPRRVPSRQHRAQRFLLLAWRRREPILAGGEFPRGRLRARRAVRDALQMVPRC
jgi:hypothetical protein